MIIEQMTDEELGRIVRENIYKTFNGNITITDKTGIATACSIFLIETFIMSGQRSGSLSINDTKDYNGNSLGDWTVTIEQKLKENKNGKE